MRIVRALRAELGSDQATVSWVARQLSWWVKSVRCRPGRELPAHSTHKRLQQTPNNVILGLPLSRKQREGS
ncbi:MAG: hypothetical protein JST91_29820 [Actinobacteria bacterium]|nr:hypothetical protein [Actinomycetota bacterium]